MSTREQSFASHTKYDPLFHFFLIPISLLVLTALAIRAWRQPDQIVHVIWMLLFIVLMFKARIYALRVQDRVIRLEERLRLAMLLPQQLRPRIPELKVAQLIGLRFASDGELPALAERALNENLSKSEIKRAIKEWRTDYWRI
jgi:hypothetical protein